MKKIFTILIYIFAGIGFILVIGYIGIRLGLTKTAGIVDTQHDYFKNQLLNTITTSSTNWMNTEEWQTLKQAIVKDTNVINKVSKETGVPSRIIVAPLVVEQLRLFSSDREVFKKIFAPLQILGIQSQFSWGVMGIKQDTAIQVETNLSSSTSPWYLGSTYAHLLDYPATTTDRDAERFARLTDSHNRYYSYLYGALNIKEIETQWSHAGININDNPGVIATLYNIGFQNSHPHANPLSGGAEINVGNTTYSFGSLAESFYYSSELLDIFPR
ncbi:MAG: hypothetical protein WCG07_01910 [Candidatus Taylorbacteria bacterium]